MNATHKRKCSARNRRGEPCQARAIERGLSAVHSGRVNPAAIGRRGGSVSPQTKMRKAADDELREQAREVLARALAGEDVPKAALDSARSLFSYRSEAPPERDRSLGDGEVPRTSDGHRVLGLDGVTRFALEIGAVTPEVVEACGEVVAAADAATGAVS